MERKGEFFTILIRIRELRYGETRDGIKEYKIFTRDLNFTREAETLARRRKKIRNEIQRS